MNDITHHSAYDDIFLNSDDEYEPYGYGDIDDSLVKIYNYIEAYKKEFAGTDYRFDE